MYEDVNKTIIQIGWLSHYVWSFLNCKIKAILAHYTKKDL